MGGCAQVVHTALLELLEPMEVQVTSVARSCVPGVMQHLDIHVALRVREQPLTCVSMRYMSLANATCQPCQLYALSPHPVRRLQLRPVQAVIAHELGHLKCDHGVWLTIANVLASGTLSVLPAASRAVEEALLRWLRAAELTCDRAALLVVQVLPCCSSAGQLGPCGLACLEYSRWKASLV